ncbi:hypothetical protein M501DRAFT_999969 [Patellaria atrata CBS 101060]|uniref:Uncharacterized protein n=1 Tax=Patellaria atrata CBS 101060 TaxID=1346257 RepID=A0A9P4S3Y8_9PEZI|nr:hypothetical protein M501DRAFT_999969 [Patellaria atrata CBS 101060]
MPRADMDQATTATQKLSLRSLVFSVSIAIHSTIAMPFWAEGMGFSILSGPIRAYHAVRRGAVGVASRRQASPAVVCALEPGMREDFRLGSIQTGGDTYMTVQHIWSRQDDLWEVQLSCTVHYLRPKVPSLDAMIGRYLPGRVGYSRTIANLLG